MAFGALVIPYFGTGPAVQFAVLQDGKFRAVGVHAELRDGIAPNTEYLLLEGSRDVHQSGVMRKNILCFLHQAGGLVDIKFSARVIDDGPLV